MIDHARASIVAINERLARIAAERASLELLRDSWEHYIALQDGLIAVTDQPEQVAGPSVSSPEPVDAPAAVSSPPGDEPSAPTSYPSDPGSARPRPGEEDGATGRRPRAQATTARRPIGSAPTAPEPVIEQPGSVLSDVGTGRVGTPTPASHPRPIVSCSECDWTGRALGVHRRHRHGHRATKPKPAAAKVDPTVQRRQRQAAEASPRAAVVKRVGNQVQCPSCKDLFVDEAKLQRHREISHGLRADGHSESYLCNRCPKTFPTREDRDAHQATHPPDPVALTVGRDSAAQREVGAGVQIA